MQISILASGSKGNSAVIAGGRTRVLVDAGLSCRELMRRMASCGIDPATLDAVLITHEHIDHVCGLSVLARKLNLPVYFTAATHRAWVRQNTPRSAISYWQWLEKLRRERQERLDAAALAHQIAQRRDEALPAENFFAVEEGWAGTHETNGAQTGMAEAASTLSWSDETLEAATEAAAELASVAAAAANATEGETSEQAAREVTALPAVEFFEAGRPLVIGDLEIQPFTIPHDAVDPCGFVFQHAGVRVGMATDLGYMPPNVKLALKNCDVLVLESNHDVEMLRDGPYPWSVKQRVLSRVGHLSNAALADYLQHDYDGGAAYVVLAHLSASNNLPELARLAAQAALGNRLSLLGNRLLLAGQDEPMATLAL